MTHFRLEQVVRLATQDGGRTAADVAHEMGLQAKYVRQIVRESGQRWPGRILRRRIDVAAALAMREDGKTYSQIAAALGCTATGALLAIRRAQQEEGK